MPTRSAWLVALAVITGACSGRHGGRPGGETEWQAFLADDEHAREYARFERYLRARGVASVVPPWQLCRQGTDWSAAGQPPFVLPPRRDWAHIVPTLRFIDEHVVPRVGPVEVVSGYRTRVYNRRAGGARASRHLDFDAVDLIPESELDRARLHARLDSLWRGPGRRARLGLGLYAGTRFHVDTHRHRRW